MQDNSTDLLADWSAAKMGNIRGAVYQILKAGQLHKARALVVRCPNGKALIRIIATPVGRAVIAADPSFTYDPTARRYTGRKSRDHTQPLPLDGYPWPNGQISAQCVCHDMRVPVAWIREQITRVSNRPHTDRKAIWTDEQKDARP